MKKYLLTMASLGLLMTGYLHASPPQGWSTTGSATKDYDMGVQPGDHGAGDNNAYIRAVKDSKGFGAMVQTVSAEAYRNQRVRLSGYLKTEGAGWAGLWMRVDGNSRGIAFDNMEDRAPRGNTDWQPYSVVLDVPSDALVIAIGFLLDGNGEVLADNFKFEIVGKDVPVTGKVRAPLPNQPVNMGFSP
jgi:hypothetical protein